MEALGPGEMPVVRPRYPHMLSEDTRVWTAFLERKIVEVDRVWYDVRVGSVPEAFRRSVGVELKIAKGIYRKRIDVVASVDGEYWVIEVKPVGSMFAIGQVLTYRRLFMRDYDVGGLVRAVVVCWERDEDINEMWGELGVVCFEVGD